MRFKKYSIYMFAACLAMLIAAPTYYEILPYLDSSSKNGEVNLKTESKLKLFYSLPIITEVSGPGRPKTSIKIPKNVTSLDSITLQLSETELAVFTDKNNSVEIEELDNSVKKVSVLNSNGIEIISKEFSFDLNSKDKNTENQNGSLKLDTSSSTKNRLEVNGLVLSVAENETNLPNRDSSSKKVTSENNKPIVERVLLIEAGEAINVNPVDLKNKTISIVFAKDSMTPLAVIALTGTTFNQVASGSRTLSEVTTSVPANRSESGKPGVDPIKPINPISNNTPMPSVTPKKKKCHRLGVCRLNGTGKDCTSDLECSDNKPHYACDPLLNICTLKAGLPEDTCNPRDPKACKPLRCNQNGQCTKDGIGAECETSEHCKYRCNDSQKCVPGGLNGSGKTCNDHSECSSPTPSPKPTNSIRGVPTNTPSYILNQKRSKLSEDDTKENSDDHTQVSKDREEVQYVPNLEWVNSVSIGSRGSTFGLSDAPVKIEVYQDINCGMCKRSFMNYYEKIFKDYVSTGKVKFVFKEFPLIQNEYELKVAYAAKCSGDQNKYLKYLSKLYQGTYKKTETDLTIKEVDSYLIGLANDIGLDEFSFKSCLASKEIKKQVESDISDGESKKVEGTPTFFLNGEELVGPPSHEIFSKLIEENFQ